ncbi:MAG: uroporphyrinogen-III C-methyltransferase [Betaproteobacteria bacterium]
MGRVYLVGAGPGAADLLTLRAARLLATADVVLHDALVSEEVLALAPRAMKVAVGKRACRRSTAQRFINKQLVDAAGKYEVVVRLKGGDPMLFGRAEEELAALEDAGIACEVVPGITAAFAASAQLQTSLTRRGLARSVAFVTPRVGADESDSHWLDAAMGADTAVLYMGGREIVEIARRLIAAGRPGSTPLAAVENASLPQERHWLGTLETAAGLAASVDASVAVLLLVGEVLRDCDAAQAVTAVLEEQAA